MIIRSNTNSRRAGRYLGTAQTAISKTLEKLSSGYRINRSADDAAGLAISEKMRLNITGLGRARLNSMEGTKLIQTGEGALQEIQDMLDRAAYMATQSANGTYEDELDRENLQKELDRICSEIDRICKSAKFNTIELFQDVGLEGERTYPAGAGARKLLEAAASAATREAASVSAEESSPKQVIKIEYVEHDAVNTAQTPGGGSSLAQDMTLGGKQLSDILKDEIVPNTVANILSKYGDAFSYLTGSKIGIGLEYFSQGASAGSTTLAYVKGQAGSTGTVSGSTLLSRTDYITYTLGVNVGAIKTDTWDSGGREELEATIAHEMIHAFMDEAATAGMFGKQSVDSGSLTKDVVKFPDWFIEGMAQTSSGPGNWLESSGGLGLSGTSTEADIVNAIKDNGLGKDSNASNYGTGYLACMYLGSVIGGYDGSDTNSVTVAGTISKGVSDFLKAVVSGRSLDSAIKDLTGGKFTSITDFQTKFNNGTAEGMPVFVKNLMMAIGTGRGSILTGDLSHRDLIPNSESSNTLFELTTSSKTVQNVYPDGYNVYSGGAANVDGTSPDASVSAPPYRDYKNLRIYGGRNEDFELDSDGTLMIKAGSGIKITMQPDPSTPAGVGSWVNHIKLNDGVGEVILSGVNLVNETDSAKKGNLTIGASAKITYESDNEFGKINLEGDAIFTGTGSLKSDNFDAGFHAVTFKGGAVAVNGGSGIITNQGTVTIDGAVLAANDFASISESTGKVAELLSPHVTEFSTITSIGIGGKKYSMQDGNLTNAALWLDKKAGVDAVGNPTYGAQKISFSGANASGGEITKTYLVTWDETNNKFKFDAYNVFTVNGGIEGTDWTYDGENNALKILTDKPLEISGGTKEIDGAKDYGTIEIADGITANLTLNKVEIDATKIGGNAAGIQLGNGSDVTLTMKGNNTITGSGEAAGIQLFGYSKRTGKMTGPYDYGTELSASEREKNRNQLRDASLHIAMEEGSTLAVTGGTNGHKGGAGIGAAWATDSSASSIKITGTGTIDAKGGMGGAGIGGSEGGDMGNITIQGTTGAGGTGLRIVALGGDHGAGIGSGGWVAVYNDPDTQVNGDITITGNVDITASSKSHGTGIGSACHSTVGNVTIGEDPTGKDSSANDKIVIDADGGNDGAAIGSGWAAKMGDVTIWGGTIDAKSGKRGAGIGSGYQAEGGNGEIIINGGKITAQGDQNSLGIGSGQNGSTEGITIRGGQITAIGGWTNSGGNIGGFDASGDPVTVKILDTEPGNSSLTIKAGKEGEGAYITTNGAVDGDGDSVYALKIGYIDELLKNNKATSDPSGSTELKFPLKKVTASMTKGDGTTVTYEWDNLQHLNEDNAYIWMKGYDVKLTVEYEDAGQIYKIEDLELNFFLDHNDKRYGLWRADADELPLDPPGPAEYVPTPPYVPPQPQPIPTPTPTPTRKLEAPEPKGLGGIILQIGANYGEILEVPRFYLSAKALELNKVDISTQQNAWDSMPVLSNAINRVSSIRGEYGALQNCLDHNQNDLSQAVENLTDAESRIRDADMVEEYTKLVKLNILQQSAQAMLSHSNQDVNRVMQLFQ